MTKRVTFPAIPESFGVASGALAMPGGEAKAPAVVVLQEFWGLNEHIESIADRWAAAGFLALAPDLYRGQVTTDSNRASKLMDSLDRARALSDIAGAAAFLRSQPRCNGKVGVTGYCLGGAFAFAAAATLEGIDAAVPFYGIPPGVDWSKVSAPIQAHFSRTDGWARAEVAEQVQSVLQAQGCTMELFIYDAPHAFCNDTRPDVYSPDAASAAWQRAVAFMQQHLGS
ncbi:MAG: dienelactone hydrolase family protein [Myxococcales bacterium]|nr:dienelactone hydrolase family protein [Myxococcales bacterium]HRC57390.1 dienelactone hydrolase family protein [Kofleriaceae bacterium]